MHTNFPLPNTNIPLPDTNAPLPHRLSYPEPEKCHTPLFSWMETLEHYAPWGPVQMAAGVALIVFFLVTF